MKKTLLSIILLCSTALSFSQNPITISSNCGATDGFYGTYNYLGIYNGKPFYRKNPTIDCSSFTTDIDCQNATSILSYSLKWVGSTWTIEIDDLNGSCFWLFDNCVPNTQQNSIPSQIAFNSIDTATPPCSGWSFSTSQPCEPTFSECTTLSSLENTFQNKFEAFPNPAIDRFQIKFRDTNKTLTVRMITPLGQILWRKDYENVTEIELNLHQPSGVYYVQLSDENNKSAYIKLIKN